MAHTDKGTIKDAENFAAEKTAATLRRAICGIATNDKVVIEILTRHSSAQRQEIAEKYSHIYGRNLIEDVMAALGGHFEDVCLALLKTAEEVLVDSLYEGCKQQDKYCVLQILCCYSAEELESIKALFIIKYNTDPESYICESFTGDLRRIFDMIIGRDDKPPDEDFTEIEGQQLYDAGVGRNWGTDKDIFMNIIASRNAKQLAAVNKEYEKISGHSLMTAIQSEFSGEIREILVSIILCAINRPMFFAIQLYNCMQGVGTDDSTLIRILVTRSEIDLADIKVLYRQKYQKELSEAVANDTNGDYQKILLRIIRPK